MADFKTAYLKTSINEGGYSNDPADAGGETWKGIARNEWPHWSGWQIVDSYKAFSDFKDRLSIDFALQSKVLEFYKAEFWDRMRGDEIQIQDVANSIYDSCVNMGVVPAVKLAQGAAGLSQTGLMDLHTLNSLNGKI